MFTLRIITVFIWCNSIIFAADIRRRLNFSRDGLNDDAVKIITGIKEKRFDKFILPSSPYNPIHPVLILKYPESTLRVLASLISDSPDGGVQGFVTFQPIPGNNLIKITMNATGLPPGKHAVHIHQFGDLSQGCKSTGDHFPNNFIGNIMVKDDGSLLTEFFSSFITLFGLHGIIGRSIVFHEKPIDINTALNAEVFSSPVESLTDAFTLQAEETAVGQPIACGIIIIANNMNNIMTPPEVVGGP